MKIQNDAISSLGNVTKNKEAYKYTNPILFDEIEKSEDRVKKINKELNDARKSSKIKDKDIEKGFTGGGNKKITSPVLKKMKLSESLFDGVKFEDDEEDGDGENDEDSDRLNDLNNKLHQNIEDLKKMHETVRSLNNENAYFNSWITAFPDEPTDEDFIIIAEDEDEFSSIVDLFNSILIDFIDDGLNNPSDTISDFVDKKCSELGCGEYDVSKDDDWDDSMSEEIRESFDEFVESGMVPNKKNKEIVTEKKGNKRQFKKQLNTMTPYEDELRQKREYNKKVNKAMGQKEAQAYRELLNKQKEARIEKAAKNNMDFMNKMKEQEAIINKIKSSNEYSDNQKTVLLANPRYNLEKYYNTETSAFDKDRYLRDVKDYKTKLDGPSGSTISLIDNIINGNNASKSLMSLRNKFKSNKSQPIATPASGKLNEDTSTLEDGDISSAIALGDKIGVNNSKNSELGNSIGSVIKKTTNDTASLIKSVSDKQKERGEEFRRSVRGLKY